MITVNGIEVKATIFPDKTSQVWKLPDELINDRVEYNIHWKFESEAELVHLEQLVMLLRSFGGWPDINLMMPYLPYARQDKKTTNQTTWALSYFGGYLSRMEFNKIFAIDPHPTIHPIYKILGSVHPDKAIQEALKACTPDVVCFPDAGAVARYQYKLGLPNEMVVTGYKRRDQETGEIIMSAIDGQVCENNILIIDDICDGGATFCRLAQDLKRLGANRIHLYVTHGLFTKGLQPLRDAGISRIFTYEGEVINA